MDFWKRFGISPSIQQCALIEEMNPVPEESRSSLSETELAQLEEIKTRFKVAIPDEISSTPLITHRIEIQDEWKNKPAVRQYPYTVSPKVQQKVAEELERMLRIGIIERCHSDWSLNVVPVIKPTGKVRLCLDARKINERTVRDAYPLPHPGRILGQLPRAKYLSTIDLSEAFLQIPLELSSRRYTAFSVQGKGMFQFTRLPFGLVNSPATLSRLMDQVLGHGELEPRVFVYLDDVVIVSETFKEHVMLLKEVARRLKAANLAINLEKSKFGVNELPFLGYLLSTQGLRPNPEKVKAVVEYERPTTITKLRRFLGMCNYYRRFIQDFSGVTTSLTDLLKTKSKVLGWNERAEEAFCLIKEKLITAPILMSSDFSKEFCIQTDASDVAVAGILTQEQEGSERVISYFSHKLTTPQRNYHACEKETLAALLAIEAFRGYIEGAHFTLITDSSALSHIMTTKWKTASRCSRWCLTLQQYDMAIVHRKGKDNIVPDALSRSIAVVSTRLSSSWHEDTLKKVQDNPDNFVDFRIEDGKLLKFVSTPNLPYDHRYEWKLVPPHDERPEIIRENHDGSMHLGVDKTIDRIKQRYFWPRLAAEVREYIQTCKTCKEVKGAYVPVVPLMGDQRITKHPWQIIAMDFVGPLPRSKKGYQHILVVLDLFSKWIMLTPVRRIDSVSLCSIVRDQWFFRNSTPEVIITDNATCFLSKEFKSLLERFNIRHWLNAKYHSQANPVERVNRTVNAAIRTYVKEDQRLWDSKLSEIETILNSSVHSVTKMTPFFITHGHELFVKGSDHKDLSTEQDQTLEQRSDSQRQLFERIYDVVERNLKDAHESGKQRYDLRHRHHAKDLEIGQ